MSFGSNGLHQPISDDPDNQCQSIDMEIDFRSFAEWTRWKSLNQEHFPKWRQLVLGAVRSNGLLEPISGIRRAPHEIRIDESNLRESISSFELNSRKRAGLLALERFLPMTGKTSPTSRKILGAEGVTRAAKILRGHFPYFLGCEYLPSAKDIERYFPIPHLDLQQIGYPDKSFDAVLSNDVLEHVPSVARVISESCRVLKSGGLMLSVYPFNENSARGIVRAIEGTDGTIVHLLPQEFHGNPVRPDEGSLVFSMPSWDILAELRNAGFLDAKFTMFISSTFGITNSGSPGVMVLSAIRG